MDLSEFFAPVNQCAWGSPYDFRISKFPVALSEAGPQPRLGSQEDHQLYRASWLEAARFCNQLCATHDLPPAHDAETGNFIQFPTSPEFLKASGFRLPTPQEWEWASRSRNFTEIQKQYYKVPHVDYPTTPEMIQTFENGYSRIEELVAAETGICGMLGHAREWCCPVDNYEPSANRMIYWEEYYTNYDVIGYQTRTRNASESDRLAFRVVCPGAGG
jgi:hypothetical protein